MFVIKVLTTLNIEQKIKGDSDLKTNSGKLGINLSNFFYAQKVDF